MTVENETNHETSPDANPSLGSKDRNPKFKWYVVHTYSMFEEKAKGTLLDRIKLNKMEHKFGDIIVPKTAQETLLKSGKKKKVERNAFPGYIIVEMEMDEDTNHLVRDTPKITGFVGNARNPRPITDQEVLRLTSPETIKEQVKQQAATQSFEKGETVKVIDGAFTNFDGVVEAVQADKMKLRILVSIFGRETPVELDYGQVQKLS
jgi:transcription termination/antitermination protein NusG